MPRRFASGSFAGEFLPGWQQLLLGPDGLRLAQWLSDGQARLVKHGPRRAVYRVDAGQQAFFIKHYRCRHWWEALGHLFRHSPSRREFDRARVTRDRQVPTAEPVAWLEARRAGVAHDNYLVTRAVADACSLDEYVHNTLTRLDARSAARMRRKLAIALARLCAAAHRQGLEHDDLHAGNLLVRLDTCDSAAVDERLPELFLIDLPNVRVSRALGRRRTVASLTMLAASCSTFASTSDMWRFLAAYLAERPELSFRSRGELGRRAARAIPERKRRIGRSRDKRSLRSNRDFYRHKEGRATALAVNDLAPAELATLASAPHAPLAANTHRPFKLSHRSMVVQAELKLDAGNVLVAYKRVRPRNWWKTLLHYFRRNPALQAWFYGHALLLRGIPTARPLAVIEQRRFGLPPEGYLATQWIEGADNLHVYGWQLAQRTPEERRRRTRQVCQSLGRLVGRMHAWHVSHRDLKGCNVLVVERDDAVDCYLIDADSVHIPRRLLRIFRAFNLGRLATTIEAHPWVTRTDRLRFFRAYLQELRRGDPDAWPHDWKQGWRTVAKARRSIVARLRRHGREIV
ncbi:MAG TPA: lipopolysaccharide kinase InaA family protein [Pirellulales bacterium]|nr:lipopolysaccharide kinase InaA family protein [Pirellulales bacterium]